MAKGLTLDQVTIRQGAQVLLSVDTHIDPGQVVTLMGASGSGKSTLLAWLTGNLPPAFSASGRVWLDGRDITGAMPQDRCLGILFQDDLLFQHLSVGGNLSFGLKAGGNRTTRKARIAAALAEVGLDDMADRDPATLSGGQRARVALMRTLLSDPHGLLLDEPFSRLDADRRAQVRDLVFERARARGLPVLMVTHDAEDAQAANGPILRV